VNANRLRRQLRTGGYDFLGRTLPAYLLEHGLPCQRKVRGLQAQFEDSPAGLRCYVLTHEGWTLVADEDRVHVAKPDLPPLVAKPVRQIYSLTMPPDLVARADQYRAGTGLSRSGLVSKALAAYLKMRGA
jgi:hypothetical protein